MNSLEGKDFKSMVKDAQNTYQFLQENAAPTSLTVKKEASSIFLFYSILIVIAVAVVCGVFYFLRR